MSDFYSLSARTAQGVEYPFAQLRGKVCVIVNVASQCGFTYQYEGLQQLFRELKGSNVEVLGFPCNGFGAQEPKPEAEIVEFCSRKYNVDFPIMQKV